MITCSALDVPGVKTTSGCTLIVLMGPCKASIHRMISSGGKFTADGVGGWVGAANIPSKAIFSGAMCEEHYVPDNDTTQLWQCKICHGWTEATRARIVDHITIRCGPPCEQCEGVGSVECFNVGSSLVPYVVTCPQCHGSGRNP